MSRVTALLMVGGALVACQARPAANDNQAAPSERQDRVATHLEDVQALDLMRARLRRDVAGVLGFLDPAGACEARPDSEVARLRATWPGTIEARAAQIGIAADVRAARTNYRELAARESRMCAPGPVPREVLSRSIESARAVFGAMDRIAAALAGRSRPDDQAIDGFETERYAFRQAYLEVLRTSRFSGFCAGPSGASDPQEQGLDRRTETLWRRADAAGLGWDRAAALADTALARAGPPPAAVVPPPCTAELRTLTIEARTRALNLAERSVAVIERGAS